MMDSGAPKAEASCRATLQSLCNGLRELHELLAKEQEALVRADIEGVHALLEAKVKFIEKLDRDAKALGLNAGTTHDGRPESVLRALTSADDGGAESRHHVEVLRDTIERCRQINQENGTIVSRGLEHSHRTLAQLRALVQSNELVTYAASGHMGEPGPGRPSHSLTA